MNHEDIRKRTYEEDTILGSRTTAFLIGNGFVLTALGTMKGSEFDPAVTFFGLLLSVVWLLTTYQSYRSIQALHQLRLEIAETDAINDAISVATFWKRAKLLGPTALVSIWLPMTVVVLWLFVNTSKYVH